MITHCPFDWTIHNLQQSLLLELVPAHNFVKITSRPRIVKNVVFASSVDSVRVVCVVEVVSSVIGSVTVTNAVATMSPELLVEAIPLSRVVFNEGSVLLTIVFGVVDDGGRLALAMAFGMVSPMTLELVGEVVAVSELVAVSNVVVLVGVTVTKMVVVLNSVVVEVSSSASSVDDNVTDSKVVNVLPVIVSMLAPGLTPSGVEVTVVGGSIAPIPPGELCLL